MSKKLFKRNALIACSFLLLCTQSGCDAQSQAVFKNVVNQIGLSNPTPTEMNAGIKEALELGASIGADRLSAKDGFLGNVATKILFPQEAKNVEQTLRRLGMNSLADNIITTLNRAAESAVIEAKPIFVAAIKQMTIADVSNILLGNNDAATAYFKRTTTATLSDRFKPIISTHLSKVGATKYWTDAAKTYNRIASNPIETDLSAYVTQKAIEGLFLEIAKEESKIRTQIGARTSPLLQKVFKYADNHKQQSL